MTLQWTFIKGVNGSCYGNYPSQIGSAESPNYLPSSRRTAMTWIDSANRMLYMFGGDAIMSTGKDAVAADL